MLVSTHVASCVISGAGYIYIGILVQREVEVQFVPCGIGSVGELKEKLRVGGALSLSYIHSSPRRRMMLVPAWYEISGKIKEWFRLLGEGSVFIRPLLCESLSSRSI